jgi:hypothetical protein
VRTDVAELIMSLLSAVHVLDDAVVNDLQLTARFAAARISELSNAIEVALLMPAPRS